MSEIRSMREPVCAALSLVLAGTAFAVPIPFDAKPLAVRGDGLSETNLVSAPLRLKPCGTYVFDVETRQVGGSAGAVCIGAAGINADVFVTGKRWTPRTFAFFTRDEGKPFESAFHLGQWHMEGAVEFRNPSVREVSPRYRRIGALELGHDERLEGDRYLFAAPSDCVPRNHSRPLVFFRRADYNTNRWVLHDKAEIAYRHELAGRRWLSATVRVQRGYHFSGSACVEVSADGTAWQALGELSKSNCTVEASVPAALLPADRLHVRIRGGARGCDLQIPSYAFEGKVDGEPLIAAGRTEYVAEDGTVVAVAEPCALYDEDYGARLPSRGAAALWTASGLRKVPRLRNLPTAKVDAIRFAAAGGETEAAQLVVTPSADAKDVRVTVAGAGFPADAAETLRVGYVPVRLRTDGLGAPGDWPDPIFRPDGGKIAVPAGVNQPFWIRVKVPAGMAKGVHRATVRVEIETAAGTETDEVPLEVEVYGFSLPKETTCRTSFGLSIWAANAYHRLRTAEDRRTVERLYRESMAAHRLSPYTAVPAVRVTWSGPKDDPERMEPVFDWATWDAAAERAFGEFGFNTSVLYLTGIGGGAATSEKPREIEGFAYGTKGYESLMAKYLGGVARHLGEMGWLDRFYVYMYDEPEPKNYPYVMSICELLRKYAPGVRRMLTEQPSAGLLGGPDVWCPLLHLTGTAGEPKCRANGDRMWWYICCDPQAPYVAEFIDRGQLDLRTWLWQTWQHDISGVLVWDTCYWTRDLGDGKRQNPYADAAAWGNDWKNFGNGDGRFFYPPRACFDGGMGPVLEGPVETLRLEALRDGLEDYEYLAILKRLDPSNPLLEVPASISVDLERRTRDPQTILAHRRAVAEEIERLSEGTYVVVTGAHPAPSVRFAAAELAKYVRRMTGRELPVAEAGGPGPCIRLELDAAKGDDAYRIVSKGGSVAVTGGRRGVLYGVYDLLETYGGCGFFAADCEVVPKAAAFRVPDGIDRTERPAFELREPLWFGAYDGDFAAKLRVNGARMELGPHHGGRTRWFDPTLRSSHTFQKLLPAEKWFAAHPEYFSEIDGVRRRDDSQPCLSNPDVLAIVVSNVLATIRSDPSARYYGVSQNDNENYCRCARCAAIDAEEESHAGTLLRFVNAVAEAVEREFPDKIVETLAYRYTRKPPKLTRPRRNVMPCLCSIECDFSVPIAAADDPDSISFRADIRTWSELSSRLYVWDYTTCFAEYILPYPNVNVLQENIRFFRAHAVKSLFEQGAYQGPGADFAALKTWLLAKWLWNPDADRETLLAKFFDGYYGAAAPFVRAYFDRLHALPRGTRGFPLKCFDDCDDPRLDAAFFADAVRLWEQAAAAVRDDPMRARNVEIDSIGADYLDVRLNSPDIRLIAPDSYAARLAPQRTRAARVLERIERRGVRLSEWPAHFPKMLDPVRRTAEGFSLGDGTRVTLGVDELSRPLNGMPFNSLVDDAAAEGGRALRIRETEDAWCVPLPAARVASDPSAAYEVRFRARVERAKGSSGAALAADLYDGRARRSVAALAKTADEAGDGYAWHRFEARPIDGLSLRVAARPGGSSVLIDRVEVRPAVGP